MRNNGFSLIEVIVVVAIMTVLLSIAIPALSKYLKKYRIESEINTLYSNLMDQRFKSMNSGIPHGIVFDSPSKYTLFEFNDKNYNLQFDGLSEEKDPVDITLSYPFDSNVSGEIILFDENGIARGKNWGLGSLTVYIDKGYSCVVVSASRVKVGVWDGSACEVK